MSNFTPGPWEVGRKVAKPLAQESLTILAPTGFMVGAVNPFAESFGDGADRANARLIAAAPQMYEALSALRNFMWAEGYADQTQEMALADAALAKADGK